MVTDKQILKKGDTLHIACSLISDKPSAATINLWIEHLQDGKRWKFRYPVLNKSAFMQLIIGDSLPEGEYALNFILQPVVCEIKGKIKDYDANMQSINMLIVSKEMGNYLVAINPDDSGSFSAGRVLFNDTVTLVFRASEKLRRVINIDLLNYLDSPFTFTTQRTFFINVGSKQLPKMDTQVYHFTTQGSGTLLPEISLQSSLKKNIQYFDRQVTKGLFRSDAKIFDGIDNAELSEAPDIFAYLQKQNTGLWITRYAGFYTVYKRLFPVDIFINETPATMGEAMRVNPIDVAMIKIFEPHMGPSISGGGAIAVYTRADKYFTPSKKGNVFIVKGYTPDCIIWK